MRHDETTDLTALVDRYIAMWNEPDSARRRALIARTWTEGASYLDPMMQGDGRSGIDAMVEGVQQRFPGHRFRRTSEVDAPGPAALYLGAGARKRAGAGQGHRYRPRRKGILAAVTASTRRRRRGRQYPLSTKAPLHRLSGEREDVDKAAGAVS